MLKVQPLFDNSFNEIMAKAVKFECLAIKYIRKEKDNG